MKLDVYRKFDITYKYNDKGVLIYKDKTFGNNIDVDLRSDVSFTNLDLVGHWYSITHYDDNYFMEMSKSTHHLKRRVIYKYNNDGKIITKIDVTEYDEQYSEINEYITYKYKDNKLYCKDIYNIDSHYDKKTIYNSKHLEYICFGGTDVRHSRIYYNYNDNKLISMTRICYINDDIEVTDESTFIYNNGKLVEYKLNNKTKFKIIYSGNNKLYISNNLIMLSLYNNNQLTDMYVTSHTIDFSICYEEILTFTFNKMYNLLTDKNIRNVVHKCYEYDTNNNKTILRETYIGNISFSSIDKDEDIIKQNISVFNYDNNKIRMFSLCNLIREDELNSNVFNFTSVCYDYDINGNNISMQLFNHGRIEQEFIKVYNKNNIIQLTAYCYIPIDEWL